MNALWERLLLAMIGETLADDGNICGAVFSRRRKGDKIALWVRSCDDADSVVATGDALKRVLGVPHAVSLEFIPHEDAKASSQANSIPPRYRV